MHTLYLVFFKSEVGRHQHTGEMFGWCRLDGALYFVGRGTDICDLWGCRMPILNVG